MKEKIRLLLKIHRTDKKGPSFKIFLGDNLLDEKNNYFEDFYENTFYLELDSGKHCLIIEHFNKDPKDTIVNNGKIQLDVAIQLESIYFNGIKCHLVDLHENYFFVSNWKYPIKSPFKNNLFFGYNGKYVYEFESPSTKYILSTHKKYKKEHNQLHELDITEDEFIKKLRQYVSDKN